MAALAFWAARIDLALFLVFLNGFFVAAEFAFVRLRSASVETLVQEGRRTAPVVQEGTENLDDYLAVSQLGITISSLGSAGSVNRRSPYWLTRFWPPFSPARSYTP